MRTLALTIAAVLTLVVGAVVWVFKSGKKSGNKQERETLSSFREQISRQAFKKRS